MDVQVSVIVGFLVTYNDVSPTLSSFLYGISNTIATLPGIIAPVISGYILGDNPTIIEWRILFYICFTFHIIGCAIYWFWGKIEYIKQLNVIHPNQ